MTSNTITMVGQCAFVNDQNEDACAVSGTTFAEGVGWLVIAGVAAATVGADAGADVDGTADIAGAVFTAIGALGVAVVATGAEADMLPPFAMVFVIATSVFCMPESVACTAASCEGATAVFAASELFNCESVAASVLKVPWNALTSLAENPVAGVAGAVAATGCETTVVAVPESPPGTIPACVSRFANVAFATSSCC